MYDFINPAISYASLARDEARYQRYLEEMNPPKEDFFDDEGVLIEEGDFYVETTECILAEKSIEKLMDASDDVYTFLKAVFGDDVEVPDPEYAEEGFEYGDYSTLLDSIDKDAYKCY
jgi:hypothetical protein